MYLQNLARGNQEKQNCVKNLSAQAIDKGNVSRFPTPGPNTNFRHPVPVLGLSLSLSWVLDQFQWFLTGGAEFARETMAKQS